LLPREILKHKLELQYGGSSGKKVVNGKRKKKALKTPTKKKNGIQIDATFIKKLEFYKQPKNLMSSISYVLKS